MKKILLLFIFAISICYSHTSSSQTNPGDIAFVGYSADGSDGFAFVTFVEIPANAIIYFTDDGWNGTMFTSDEGAVTWTNDSGNPIPIGTVVIITSASSSPSASVGSATESNAGFDLSGSGDAIIAFIGTDDNTPTTFLAAIAINDFVVADVTDLSGLVIDDTAIEMDNKTGASDDDVGVYVGSTICDSPTSIAACRQMITDLSTNPNNWLTEEGAGDQSQNGMDAEFPTPNGGGTGVPGNFSGTTLPIELTYFTATPKATIIALNWRTETELNNAYMAVERSLDGENFTEIGREKGAGTTVEPQVYVFMDEAPKAGINYYRLRQVDTDGTVNYHKVVAVSFNTKDVVTTVFPTLATDFVTLQTSKVAETEGVVTVISLTGKVVTDLAFAKGANQIELNTSNLAAGQYFVRLAIDGAVTTTRFIKQ